MKTIKKVYVTKYALSKGIEYLEVKTTSIPDLVTENIKCGRNFHKGDWFETEIEAINKAMTMKAKKIKSLELQLDKIKSMKFNK